VSRLKLKPPRKYLSKYLPIWILVWGGLLPNWTAQAIPLVNEAQYNYELDGGISSNGTRRPPQTVTGKTNQLTNDRPQGGLVDPLGTITGCNGDRLPSYEGFSVGLYDTPDRLRLGNLANLSLTELPDDPTNNIPLGQAPNTQNINPYSLTVGNASGTYNFLLDRTKGQLAVGRSYILAVRPPATSNYVERQVLLEIRQVTDTTVTLRATALDNQVLALDSQNRLTQREITQPIVNPTNALTTALALVGFNVGVCNPQSLQIVKTADRAAAEPGDTVVYRLVVKNLSTTILRNLVVTDILPLGFRLQTNGVRAQGSRGGNIPVTVSQNGNTVTFRLGQVNLSETVNIAYPTTLTPEAVRGDGRNRATILAVRGDNSQPVQDGPSTHQLLIRSGITADTGTIIGRVFVDKNFDGEQQANEPGIPNAVVYLDQGNRITTDANGMFSVRSVISGYRTGVLDLSSLPGYTLAPNLYIKERNSQSRLVKLAPSGLVRMNFGVTPTAQEGK
jgi:uncharacterized repeat protein (TIGR01451 family)